MNPVRKSIKQHSIDKQQPRSFSNGVRKKSPAFKIGSHYVGAGHPCFIVAEVSANHNQSFQKAMAIIKAAAKAGADAIK